jgi:hypothetical protein
MMRSYIFEIIHFVLDVFQIINPQFVSYLSNDSSSFTSSAFALLLSSLVSGRVTGCPHLWTALIVFVLDVVNNEILLWVGGLI